MCLFRRTLTLAGLVLLVSVARVSAALKSTYKTAFFWPIPGSPPTVWKATFEDYLNEKVGPKLNVTFEAYPARYPGYNSIESYLESGEIDFLYAPAVLSECYSSIYQTAPLLTTKYAGNSVLTGGVIFAKDDRDDIVSLADVKDKVVAANLFVSLTSYGMQVQTFTRAGIHLLSEAKQVRMFTGVSPVGDVITGTADIGLAPATSVVGLPVKILHRLELETPTGPYPYPVSTNLIPNTPFSVTFGTEEEVIQEVMLALLQLNSSHPAAQAAKYAGFTHAQSYGGVRNAMQEAGTLRLEDREWKCYSAPPQLYDFITCPENSIRKSRDDVTTGCAQKGLECPDRATCVCSPCLEADEIDLHLIRINGTDVNQKCGKMAKCGAAEQTKILEFKVVDNLRRVNQSVEYRLWDSEADEVGGLTKIAIPDESVPYTYWFNISSVYTGNILLELFINGEQMLMSPTLIGISEKSCDGAGRSADKRGLCVCNSGSVEMRGGCIDRGTLLVSILIPSLLLLCLVALGYLYFRLKAAEATWKIDRKHIVLTDPPEVLGLGAAGEVIAGRYRGTEVAVKRMHGGAGGGATNSGLDLASLAKLIKVSKGLPGFGGGRRTSVECLKGEALRGGGSPVTSGQWVPGSPILSGVARRSSAGSLPPGSPTRVGAGSSMVAVSEKAASVTSRASVVPVMETQAGECVDKESAMLQSIEIDRAESGGNTAGGETPLKVLTASGPKLQSNHKSTTSNTKRFIAEVKLLASLRHPSITTMMGAVVDKEGTMLVMELMTNGSLSDMCLNDAYILDGEIVHPIFQNIAAGMDFLHESDPSIVHADLKAANVLVDEKFRAKVADFGLSKSSNALRGTPYWMAPELLLGDLPSIKSDVFAFGILIYEVMSRKTPYEGEDPKQVLGAVADPALQKRPKLPDHTPEEIKALFKNLVLPAPQLRISFAEIRKQLDALSPNAYKMTWSAKGKVARRRDAKQAQEMFHSMFPPHIAEALVRGETPPEDKSECATVFFSDIVGFTSLSSTLNSHQVSDMLDRLFKKYDAIASECGVYKLETIGDCYIGVTNLVTEQPSDHVARMAKFSLGVMQASKETWVDPSDPSKGHVNIRIGFESGPVTGNVVGTTNKKYTIFGNTVNCASRMESTGEPGRIQCTENAAKLLRQQDPIYPLEPRGEVAVKGRGKMETFWLNPPPVAGSW